MEIDGASSHDDDDVRAVVRRSFRASYSMSPATIDGVLSAQFDEHPDGRAGSELEPLVAVDDGAVVGYAEGSLDGETGTIEWLHVDPPARSRGVGTRLFEAAADALSGRGAERVALEVLASNEEGEAFADRLGLELVDRRDVELGGEEFVERVYVDEVRDDERIESAPAGSATAPSGAVADEEAVPGDEAPFVPLYREPDADGAAEAGSPSGAGEEDAEQYGWRCSNCGATVTTADSLGRVRCEECGNVHRPDEWDGSYL